MNPTAQDSTVHAAVAIVVVICATVLAATGTLTPQEAEFVYGTALGYAAGRSGTRPGGANP